VTTTVRPGASSLVVREAFAADPSLHALAVVDDHGRPLGLINRLAFFESLAQPGGHGALSNRPAALMMDRTPLVVDEYTSLTYLSEILCHDESGHVFDGFIVTRNGRYLGTGTAFGLLRKLADHRQVTLAQVTYHDALTALPNRQLFLDRLAQAMASAARNHRRVAVLRMELDRFKAINEEFGYSIGDLLLQQTADRLRPLIRAQDTVARLSGDEFGFVLTDVGSIDRAELVAQKLVHLVRQPHTLDGQEIVLSCSVGLAAYPDHSADGSAILQMADDALYVAKRTRNAAQCYSDEMARPAHRPILFNAVRRAIEARELEVHYQPLADLHTGAIRGLEALVRWRTPARGVIPTNELIHIAEESGNISEITDFVCGAALQQLARWNSAGLAEGLRLSINVSGTEVRDGVLLPLLKAHVRAAGLALSMIEIELTERGLMHSDEDATALLSELRAEGVRVSVDDFGTGYSSLGRLQRLPVDVLKIDRAFIDDIGPGIDSATGMRQGALVEAIVAMAHSLGLTVVAEGVETEEQRTFLVQHGCDLYQGYLLSPPLSAEDTTRFLSERIGARPRHATATATSHLVVHRD
jgi:diguanylate cyclase (GGDEF)-like protein